MASQKPQSPTMEFLINALKADPKATYADIKAKADEKKHKLFPIMFGRAQAMLGIVKSAKRGAGKAAQKRAAKASAAPAGRRGPQLDANSKSGKIRELLKTGLSAGEIAKKLNCTPALVYNVKARLSGGGGGSGRKRGPGRPRAATSASMDGIAGILDAVKGAERERAHLRSVLGRVQTILEDALA